MSHDQNATLVKMANQIAANFGAYQPDEAAERVAQHLKRFWAPAMRNKLIAESAHSSEFSPITLSAVEKLNHLQQEAVSVRTMNYADQDKLSDDTQ